MKRRTGYLIKRNKTYYAAWHIGDKLFMRTTGKQDKRDAETELHRIMEPFVAGDEVATLQNIAAKIEGNKADIARLTDERNPPLTIGNAWNTYKAAPSRPDSGERTLSDYEGYLTAFSDWIDAEHSEIKAVRDVSQAIANEYAAHLSAKKLAANSFNKHIGCLELVFRIVKTAARLSENPWTAIQRKRVVHASRRELTTDELRAVCAAASGEMRLLFALGIYTGLRLGDAATLRWAEVDLPRRIIRRIPAKIARRNPAPVSIPIHATLAAMLAEVGKPKRGEYVLPETAAQYERDNSAISKRIQEHFEACGIRTAKTGTGFITVKNDKGEEERVSTGKRAVLEVGFHSLRHTFVSLCRESGAPLAVVEAIVGHSSPAMTRHYTHVGELAAATAVNALPTVIGDSPAPALPPAKLIDAEQVKTLADKLSGKNWRTVKAELLGLCA